jgi:prepilin-type N-terminal cleavage/methylation domain-containing protein
MLPEILNDKNHQRGFTLIEILIVMGITLILVTAAVPIYGNLQVSAQLNENTSQIVQTARIARERSAARFHNASHGVYFEINAGARDRFILYQGDSYAGRDNTYDRAVTLDNALSLSTTLAGNEVNFSKGLGVPNSVGIITLTHDVTGSRVMSINNFGIVEEN